jgi:hypothetical protein
MKRNLILALLALALTIPAFAQKDCPECKEKERKAAQMKMMKMKRATFTQNLKLSEEESEKFWPLYEQYNDEINSVIEKQHSMMSKFNEKDLLGIDEESALMIIKQNSIAEKDLAEIKIRYYEKFLEVLPAQKVAKLIKEEKQIMHKIRKRDRQEAKPQEQIQKKEQNSLQLVPKK